MSAMQALQRISAALQAALPQLAVVSVHAMDLSDAQTGKWLLRLPGVYLVCEGIDASAPDAATLRLRLYLLVRMADARGQRAQEGWQLAEQALAVVVADPVVRSARLIYRDQSGLDQPGIALWEIEAQARHVLATADCAPGDDWSAQTVLASWAPWIGAAHEPKYERVTGDAPSVGNVDAEELLP